MEAKPSSSSTAQSEHQQWVVSLLRDLIALRKQIRTSGTDLDSSEISQVLQKWIYAQDTWLPEFHTLRQYRYAVDELMEQITSARNPAELSRLVHDAIAGICRCEMVDERSSVYDPVTAAALGELDGWRNRVTTIQKGTRNTYSGEHALVENTSRTFSITEQSEYRDWIGSCSAVRNGLESNFYI